MVVLSFFVRFGITVRTAQLSWLHAWKIWAKVSIWRLTFLEAMLMCQEIPLLRNRSVWLSWYFLGKYFIVQSCTINIDDLSSDSRMSTLAASWSIEHSMWALHANMFAFACVTVNARSLLTPGLGDKRWLYPRKSWCKLVAPITGVFVVIVAMHLEGGFLGVTQGR